MLEDGNKQKYPFLLVFIQFCGLGETPKYVSLADVRSAIYLKAPIYLSRCVMRTSKSSLIISMLVGSRWKAPRLLSLPITL